MADDMDYAKMLADEAVTAAAQVDPATFATAKAITSITYALADFNEIAKKVLASIEALNLPEVEEPYTCDTCGLGQGNTDAIDWDVIYGHERCKNTECPLHTQETS